MRQKSVPSLLAALLLLLSYFPSSVFTQSNPVTLSATPASVSGFLMNDTDWVTRSAWNETYYKTVWMKVSIGTGAVTDPVETDYLEIQLFHIPHALINFVELCRGTQYMCKVVIF